jgi:hypothetical protein
MSGLEIDIQTSNTGASSESKIHQNFSSCRFVYALLIFLTDTPATGMILFL